jgi:hypothetical protein
MSMTVSYYYMKSTILKCQRIKYHIQDMLCFQKGEYDEMFQFGEIRADTHCNLL